MRGWLDKRSTGQVKAEHLSRDRCQPVPLTKNLPLVPKGVGSPRAGVRGASPPVGSQREIRGEEKMAYDISCWAETLMLTEDIAEDAEDIRGYLDALPRQGTLLEDLRMVDLPPEVERSLNLVEALTDLLSERLGFIKGALKKKDEKGGKDEVRRLASG